MCLCIMYVTFMDFRTNISMARSRPRSKDPHDGRDVLYNSYSINAIRPSDFPSIMPLTSSPPPVDILYPPMNP